MNPEQDLNQADPLGLSDTERAIIDEAVNAKKENNGKLIVMLNNASAMEIEEIKNNTGVDAILEVGLPGGYGFYGVADVLSGEVNPSGHLADTYAVDNSSSPAAQNYGNYEWTNADSAYSINSEIVEAEGSIQDINITRQDMRIQYWDREMLLTRPEVPMEKHGTMKMKFRIHLDTDCLIQLFSDSGQSGCESGR